MRGIAYLVGDFCVVVWTETLALRTRHVNHLETYDHVSGSRMCESKVRNFSQDSVVLVIPHELINFFFTELS